MSATFICYRGSGVDKGIGKKIGAQIFEFIKGDPYFGDVFYSPEMPDNHFIKEACEHISKSDNFIVILSPNFFSDFEKNGEINSESVTYHELNAAFENKNCIFRPIRVYGFDWNTNDNIEKLKRFFPNHDVSRLYQRTGLELDGNTIEKKDVQKFRTPETQIAGLLTKKELQEEIDNCVDTIFESKVPLNPESMLSDISEYLYMNKDKKLVFPDLFRKEFAKVSAECGLSDAQFCYWPVDLLLTDTKQRPSISICAVCFGTLILNYWLTIDRHRNKNTIDGEILEEIQQTVNGAINLLIALRSPFNASWPASWEFDASGVDGTVNQTTLSLSTLLACGFLSTELTAEVFEKRYYYIVKSIDWLLSSANTTHQHLHKLVGWGHMSENKDIATLPTAFAMDTLMKFNSCLGEWQTKLPADTPFLKELKEKKKEIQEKLCQCAQYFCYSLINETGFGTSKTNKEISITHTSKVLKTLTRFSKSMEHEDASNGVLATVNGVLERVKTYLVQYKPERILNMTKEETFEPFEYTNSSAIPSAQSEIFTPSKGENFELCGELIYLDALITYASAERELSESDIRHIADVFNRFRDKNIGYQNERFLVSGHRSDFPMYPIYAMYYYRMVLDDLYKLGDNK